MKRLSRASVILLFFLAPLRAQADNVIFNEIAWMGTASSSNDEWIELYNNAETKIILENWKISAGESAKQIILNGEIQPKGYYLLERTDDNTVPDIAADLIYSGALKNSGEKLELYDNSGNLIDFLDCSSGWFSGSNETKQTMERINPESDSNASSSWQNGGTPRDKNNEQQKIEILSDGFEKDYPDNIIFSEILPSPEGPDAENEWIELFNKNAFDADLSGWEITDSIGTTKTYIFPEKTTIKAKEFLVISRPETKITLNNEGDSLKLIKPNGALADEITYEKAPNNQSFNATENGWSWSNTITPNAKNIITLNVEVKKQNNSSTIQNESLMTGGSKYGLAQISAPSLTKSQKNGKSFYAIILAIALSIISAMAVLAIKNSLERRDN